MAQLPAAPAVQVEDLYRWFKMKKELDALKFQESELRRKLAAHYFPEADRKEGVNKLDLADLTKAPGYVLELDHGFDRKVDPALLDALKKLTVSEGANYLMLAGYNQAAIDALVKLDPDALVLTVLNISADKLVRYKPELNTREWRTLTAEQHKVFDTILDIKPSSPQLAVRPTAEEKKRLEAAAAPKAPPPTDPGVAIPVFLDPNKPPF